MRGVGCLCLWLTLLAGCGRPASVPVPADSALEELAIENHAIENSIGMRLALIPA